MDAEALLRRAGWRPGRSVAITADAEALRAEGFAVTEAAEAFLREFSHLVVAWESQARPLLFDGVEVSRNADPGWCDLYSEAIGSRLVPVGEYSHMTVYVDEVGELWGGFDGEYGHRGSVLDLIESIFLRTPRGFDRRIEMA